MKAIKTFGILMGLIAAAMFTSAQDKGGIISQDRTVPEFNSIIIDVPAKIILNQAGTAAVRVEAPEKLQDKVQVKVEDKTLKFDLKGGAGADVKIYVTVKDLNYIEISGPAVLSGESAIKSDKLKIKAGDASEVTLDLDVDKLTTKISGASDVTLKGKANEHNSEISGAANLKAAELQTKKTGIEASGAAFASVDATEELSGDISGAANLKYKSKPPVYKIEESGAANSEVTDTTKLSLGDKRVYIFDKKHHHDHGNMKDHRNGDKDKKVDFKVFGIDFGVNGYVNENFKFSVPEGRSYLEPNYGRSFGLGIDLLNIGIPIVKKHMTLWFGPGFEFNNYFFKNNYHLFTDSSMINAKVDSGAAYNKNKLTVSWFRIPVLFTFNFKAFNFSLGVIGAVKMGSHTKQVWEDAGTTHVAKTYDDFYLNPFKADATFRIGFGPVNIFGNYTFTGMYRNGHGPKLYPVTLGLTYSLFSGK